MIGIIDYGMGNLHSVTSACSHLGLETKIGSSPAELEDCSKLILPGVGAFEDMIGALHKNGLYTWLLKKSKKIASRCSAFVWACRLCTSVRLNLANTKVLAFCREA
ncbi:hypothetical protein [Allobaculum sp. Allo2]|uniref:hypothetical protein n=1 Tax=Allobaculum sp. Allo2 TaxID=2853432 RepID=UPI001F602C2E|nr:hypothetical protein [Allobaculum sp. Allo2]